MEESDISEDDVSEEKTEMVLDPNNPEHYFLIVERDFNKTQLEIEKIPEALHLIEPFNKLFERFFRTYSNQQDLENQVTGLRNEIGEKDNKIDLYMKLSEEDEKTINDLKKQIQNAWRLADAAHSREQQAIEVIDNLRRQVEKLNSELDFKNKMNLDEDTDDLAKNRDNLERERDRLINEVTQLNTKLQNAIGYQEELERKNSEADLKMNTITCQLEDQSQETGRQKKAKEKVESENQSLKYKIEERELQIAELNRTVKEKIDQIHILEKDIKELKSSHEKIAKNLDYSILKLSRLTDEHNNVKYEADFMKMQLTEKIMDIKAVNEELVKLKTELAKTTKVRDLLEKRVTAFQYEKEELIIERGNLRHRMGMIERELDDFKKFLTDDKRQIDLMTKEKDMLNKNIQRQQAIHKDQLRLIQIQEQAKKKLELELDLFFIESGKQKKLIARLERERDKLSEEQLDLTNTIQDQLDDIRLKKTFIFELRKDVTEKDTKIRQQQNLYEAIRSDRNALQKSLQESTSEGTELRRKLKLINIQAEQLKENIGEKEKQLIKHESMMRKVNKEKEQLKLEVMLKVGNIKMLKSTVKDLNDERKKLQETILFQKQTMKQQDLQLHQLMNERDILGTQLVRRNDEVALLNEKIVILQATLARGEAHYELRLSDIRLMKMEVKRLRQEKSHISKTMASMVDLRQEIFHLERDLTKSRLKCKALEQEVQNPLNIHRWRKLAGSDPDVLDLLQKIQILQRRMLHQGSIAVERERQLKQSEKLYLNLRKVVARQPGPAIQDELSRTQRALKQRGNKLKSLVSELNMADLKANEYKSDLQKLTDELAEMKKKYITEKKAHRALRMAYESSREMNQNGDSEAGDVKFTGGGFRMSVSKITTK